MQPRSIKGLNVVSYYKKCKFLETSTFEIKIHQIKKIPAYLPPLTD